MEGSIRGTVADPSPGAAGLGLKTLPGLDLETYARAECGENVPRKGGEPKLQQIFYQVEEYFAVPELFCSAAPAAHALGC